MERAKVLPSDPGYVYHDAIGSIGYTKLLSEKRVKVYNTVAENSTLFCRRSTRESIDVIIPGSRGEGAGIWNESDVDVLFVQRTVKCMEMYPRYDGKKESPVQFLLDFDNAEGGYAMLRLISIRYTRTDKQFIRNIRNSLVQRNGFQYLRNDQIFTAAAGHHREGVARQQFVFDDTTGPARKIVCELPFLEKLSIDRVMAFSCSFPSVLDTWCKRERKLGWPNNDLIEKVNNLEVFVVPVGVKGSDDEVLQWRISVTLAERALVHSFNDTQIKLYVAMKMLVKHELNPVCDNISSYVVKNLIFWMFEETCFEQFTRENFGECLMQLLRRLRRSVTWRYLPSYMFPSRNILKNKILEKERIELIHRLDIMIGEGPCVLRRCPLIKEVIDLPKVTFQKKFYFLELVEQLVLAILCIPSPHFYILMKEKVIKETLFHLTEVEIAQIVLKYAIPLIRRYNPYEYFDHLRTLSNEEILRRLWEGIFLYSNKV